MFVIQVLVLQLLSYILKYTINAFISSLLLCSSFCHSPPHPRRTCVFPVGIIMRPHHAKMKDDL